MKNIKAYVDYDNETKTHYYQQFDIVEKLPSVGDVCYEDPFQKETIVDIKEVSIDTEQGNDEVYNYLYYELVIEHLDKDDNETEQDSNFICIKNEDEEEEL